MRAGGLPAQGVIDEFGDQPTVVGHPFQGAGGALGVADLTGRAGRGDAPAQGVEAVDEGVGVLLLADQPPGRIVVES